MCRRRRAGTAKNAAIQIRREVANVLKHARLSTEEESAAPAPAAEEKQEEKRPQSARHPLPGRRRKQRQPVKEALSRKAIRKERQIGRFPWWLPQGSKSGRYLWKGFRGRAYSIGKILCRKWERLSSAARLWMWKREEIRNEEDHTDFPGYGLHRLHHSKNVPAQRAGAEIKEHVKKVPSSKIKGVTSY